MAKQDGVLPPVPAQDRTGAPHDFSQSARQQGAKTVELTGQGTHDMALLAAHTGIVASPDAWQATYDFLSPQPQGGGTPAPSTPPADGGGDVPVRPRVDRSEDHPATGGGMAPTPLLVVISGVYLVWGWRRRAMTRL